MKTRLVNVRLDEDRLRKVRALREKGVPLSELVREAIDSRFEKVVGPKEPRDIDAILDRIFEEFPDPPDRPPLPYDPYDRHAAREAIREKLAREFE